MPSKIFQPYPYQEDAIQASLDCYEVGRQAHVLELPTGAGKTLIAGEATRRFLSEPSMTALMLVPWLDLVEQTWKKYTDYFFSPFDIGIIQGATNEIGKRITIASTDTLAKPERLEMALRAQGGHPWDMIVYDECHRSLSASYKRIQERGAGRYTYQVGPSATPYRSDGQSLLKFLPDGLAYSIDFCTLIAQNYLSDIHSYNIPTNLDLDELDIEGLYNDDEKLSDGLKKRIQQSNRHARAYEAWKGFTGGKKRTLVFAQDIDDAYAFQRYIQAKGHECEVVTGKFSKETRKDIYDRFESGSLNMICNYNVLSTGIDFPFVECIIIMRSMGQGLWTQAVGRGLRLCPEIGKEYCILINMMDTKRTLMSMNKLIGSVEDKEISSVRAALREKLEEQEQTTETQNQQEQTERLSITVQLRKVEAQAYDLFAGSGWTKQPVTGDFFKDAENFGTLWAEKTFTGYQVYLRSKAGRRTWIAQTSKGSKEACILGNQFLERKKLDKQKRSGNHPDLVLPITEEHWNYLKLRRVGCIGSSWEDATDTVKRGDTIMKEKHYYPLETQLHVQKTAFAGGRFVRGPLAPLKKTSKKKAV